MTEHRYADSDALGRAIARRQDRPDNPIRPESTLLRFHLGERGRTTTHILRLVRSLAPIAVGLLILAGLTGCGPSRPDDAPTPTIVGVVQSLDKLPNGHQAAVLADGTRYEPDGDHRLNAEPQPGVLLLAGTYGNHWKWYLIVPPATSANLAPGCPFVLHTVYAWEVSDAMLILVKDDTGGGTFGLRLPKALTFETYELRGNPWFAQDWCVDTRGEITRHP